MKLLFLISLIGIIASLVPKVRAADYQWCALGNSFSFRNSLYQTLQYFIANDGSGETTRFQRAFEAGSALQEHWLYERDMLDIRRIFRSRAAFDKEGRYLSMLENGPWDYFVLQHYPGTGDDPSPLRLRPEATRRWVEWVERLDPTIDLVLYATPVAAGNSLSDYIVDQSKLDELNRAMAEEHGILLIPCGEAWIRVFNDRPEYWTDRVLHAEDNFHPDDAGTYLNACLFYAFFTGRSPVGLPWDFEIIFGNEKGSANFDVELDASLARYLQEKAWETYQAEVALP